MLVAMTTGTAQALVTVGVRLLDPGPLIVSESASANAAETGTTTVTGIAGWTTVVTGMIDAQMTEDPHRPTTDAMKHGTLLLAAATNGTSSHVRHRGTWEKNAPSSVPLQMLPYRL